MNRLPPSQTFRSPSRPAALLPSIHTRTTVTLCRRRLRRAWTCSKMIFLSLKKMSCPGAKFVVAWPFVKLAIAVGQLSTLTTMMSLIHTALAQLALLTRSTLVQVALLGLSTTAQISTLAQVSLAQVALLLGHGTLSSIRIMIRLILARLKLPVHLALGRLKLLVHLALAQLKLLIYLALAQSKLPSHSTLVQIMLFSRPTSARSRLVINSTSDPAFLPSSPTLDPFGRLRSSISRLCTLLGNMTSPPAKFLSSPGCAGKCPTPSTYFECKLTSLYN